MTIRSTFVKCIIAAVTIAAAAVVFSVRDNAAAAPLNYSGYAKKAKEAAMIQSTNTSGGATATRTLPGMKAEDRAGGGRAPQPGKR
jgi:hypothetical protein